MSYTAPVALTGLHILVAEDEYMIADEIAGALSDVGVKVIGPLSSVADILRLVAAEETLDAALLDVNLHDEMVWPAVDALHERGTPIVLTTGYEADVVPAAYKHLPRCEKPAYARDIMRALIQALEARTTRSRYGHPLIIPTTISD